MYGHCPLYDPGPAEMENNLEKVQILMFHLLFECMVFILFEKGNTFCKANPIIFTLHYTTLLVFRTIL